MKTLFLPTFEVLDLKTLRFLEKNAEEHDELTVVIDKKESSSCYHILKSLKCVKHVIVQNKKNTLELIPTSTSTSTSEIQKGWILYNTNPFLKSLCNIMEHPEMRQFIDKYVNHWNDFKTILFFLKTYQLIEHKYNNNLPAYQKLYLLQKLITSSQYRHKMIHSSPINK